MVDAPDPGRDEYKRYRSSRRLLSRAPSDPSSGLAELRALRGEAAGSGAVKPPGRSLRRRVGRWLAFVIAAWLGVSLVAFLVSSVFATGVPSSAVAALNGGGLPPFASSTILVLGTDGRPPGSREPGASSDSESSGPVRSDTMLLIRTGAGHTSRLSIPRDTLVDLPGYGMQKINAAYFFGGAAGAIREVRSFLGIRINHASQRWRFLVP
jgi:hypothetical protein